MEIKPPEYEINLGMGVYKSKTPGIGGILRVLPEDFIVEEITPEGVVLEVGKDACEPPGKEDRFIHATLEKYNWDTLRAIKEVASSLHMSVQRIGYAGTKDKRALTAQRISIFGKKAEDLANVRIKDITLRNPRYDDDNIGLGCLTGNRFTITVRGVDGDANELKERLDSIMKELYGQVPSFYGVQRFGAVRPVTHLVGREMLRGDYKAAVMTYLAKDFPGEEPDVRRTRKNMWDGGDVRQALKEYPPHLSYEHALLNYLVNHPDDYRGALRVLPKNLGQMFIHAQQAYIFNKALSEYIRLKVPVERLPLPGYKTEVDEVTQKYMDEEGVKKDDYRVRGMSDYGSKGEYRDCYIPVEGFEIVGVSDDELNEGKKKAVLRFGLQKGNYATVFLREVMKN